MSRRCPVCRTEYPDEVAFCGNDGAVNIEVTPPGAQPDPRLGEKLGDYVVVAHVADGAMGAVYEARNAQTRARVAIKVLHPDVQEDGIAVERFNREYETAATFEHPHIVKVVDFGVAADGAKFMTMEYLVGIELGELLRSRGAQPPARVLRMLAQVAQALEHAHSFGVIHRDLKPDNIFLCATDRGDDVRILDFGSVKLQVETGPKLTAFGTTLGSPYYMSPEQAKGLPDVDTRTDVFAMAAILYEALSGKIAFEAPTVAEILMKIVRSMPAPVRTIKPELPEAIDAVIAKGLAKNKAERHATPSEFVQAALAAYRVKGSVADWASRSEGELAAAIEAAAGRPPSIPPVAAAPIEPPALAGTPEAVPTAPEARAQFAPAGASLPAPAAPSGSRALLFGAIGLVAVVLVCALFALAYALLG